MKDAPSRQPGRSGTSRVHRHGPPVKQKRTDRGAEVRLQSLDAKTTSPEQGHGAREAFSQGSSSCNKDKESFAFFCFCGMAASAAFVIAVIFAGLYLSKGHRIRKGPSEELLFCCPEEAEELFRYVNTSLKPCRDFIAYTCSNDISEKRSKRQDKTTELMSALITGVLPTGFKKGQAGRFLTAYYRTCMEAVPKKNSLLSSVAVALCQSTWKRLGLIDTRAALAYLFAASFKYYLPSIAIPSVNWLRSSMTFRLAAICNPVSLKQASLATPVESVNVCLNATATMKGTHKLALTLCKLISTTPENKKNYALPNKSAAFHREVWKIDDLEDALNGIGYALASFKSIEVTRGDGIRLLHDFFNKAEQNRGVITTAVNAASYLIWHSLTRAATTIYSKYDGSSTRVFHICKESVSDMRRLWNAFVAEMLSSPDKDAEAMAIFTEVKRAVFSDCQASELFEAEDAEHLSKFFGDLTLLTPTAASRSTLVALPKPTRSFGENFLSIRSSEAEIIANRRRLYRDLDATFIVGYGLIEFLGERRLLLLPESYSYIETGSKNHDLPNRAMVGRMMAESMWYMTLYQMSWNARTSANIQSLKRCFKENYFAESDKELDKMTVAALGLYSVLNVVDRTHWHVPRPAFSLWQLSHAQFFYAFTTYYRCPTSVRRSDASYINAPLTYIEDFAESFNCPSGTPMVKPRHCAIRGTRT
ncbi:hypothetical protein HPB49_015021 [Dermacentor silvarum]|uniref:Uncharacterized protein n=1 Tax=Dermacentor silvarum TaxID=543639 RepID=A0ACB8DPU2_DERSI|nr:hypothetical protein HPB49_015021 [Dermacentor silvarum]